MNAKTATVVKPVVEKKVASKLALTKAQQKVCDNAPTVSARIRYLDSEGFTRSQITKLITNASGGELRYQHVRNVLLTPLTTKVSLTK